MLIRMVEVNLNLRVAVDYFIKYIRGEKKRPSDFYITLDGTDGIYWYCGYASQCAGGSASLDIKECRENW